MEPIEKLETLSSHLLKELKGIKSSVDAIIEENTLLNDMLQRSLSFNSTFVYELKKIIEEAELAGCSNPFPDIRKQLKDYKAFSVERFQHDSRCS